MSTDIVIWASPGGGVVSEDNFLSLAVEATFTYLKVFYGHPMILRKKPYQ